MRAVPDFTFANPYSPGSNNASGFLLNTVTTDILRTSTIAVATGNVYINFDAFLDAEL